ncbi:hypothetical protein CAAN1_09S03048 [[Candida] anglica]|uniref:Uncharacterized protein n=1 Tax=[Candida] anglica TaxID=148631 RepID=A0ABP0EJJ0_9ASCO
MGVTKKSPVIGQAMLKRGAKRAMKAKLSFQDELVEDAPAPNREKTVNRVVEGFPVYITKKQISEKTQPLNESSDISSERQYILANFKRFVPIILSELSPLPGYSKDSLVEIFHLYLYVLRYMKTSSTFWKVVSYSPYKKQFGRILNKLITERSSIDENFIESGNTISQSKNKAPRRIIKKFEPNRAVLTKLGIKLKLDINNNTKPNTK